jgi:DNA-binding NarL/FixJ family response regulator
MWGYPNCGSSVVSHTGAMEGTVCIVDDDPQFRRAAAELLGARGFEVVGDAGSATEGLALASELEPEAVLLDVHLPDGDGISLAARLSADASSPLVLLTSSDRDAVPARSLEDCGATGFVAKADLARADLDRFLKR